MQPYCDLIKIYNVIGRQIQKPRLDYFRKSKLKESFLKNALFCLSLG